MKGICFTEPLFHKVVKGEKTQTRRMITPQPSGDFAGMINYTKSKLLKQRFDFSCGKSIDPKYMVGEIVYLKEPYILYQEDYQESKLSQSGIQYAYKFGSNLSIEEITGKSDSKWSNKLFMPESAARYFVEITAVRVERLQDISEEDCLKEGIESFTKDNQLYKFGLDGWDWSKMPRTPREAYASLINKINGKGTWERNPFVWVYDFRLMDLCK